MKTIKGIVLFSILVTMLTSCADVTPIEACVIDSPYGFFGGLWHGFIIWFSFIGSLFSDNIAVYATNNTGGWYDFGFMLGLSTVISSSTKAAAKTQYITQNYYN